MANDLFTIVLKGKGHHDEGVLDEIVSPGHAIRMAADGDYDLETLTPTLAAERGLKIAKEDALQGKTVDDAYAVDDIVFFYQPMPGDHINVLVKSGEDIDIGDYLAVEGSGSGLFVEVASATDANNPIALTDVKTHDDLAVTLPATAAADDMGLITGTPGTDAPSLQGVDFGATTSDEKGSFEFVLPPSYRAGEAITLRAKAGMLTTISDGTATLDVEAWKDAGDGSVGSDLCATAAQDINSLTMANKDFTITPTGCVAGDKLIIRLSFAGSDTGNLGVMIQEIQTLAVLLSSAISGQFEALEDSGGALAANQLLICRCVSV